MYFLLRFPLSALALTLAVAASGSAPSEERAEDEKVLKQAGVGVDGPGLLEFFRKRTLSSADQHRVALLVQRLGDERYGTRAHAHRDVLAIGPPALPALRKALQSPDAEVRDRAVRCIYAIEKSPGPALPTAALHLLRERRPVQACAVLLSYLPFADNEDVAEDAVGVLAVVGFKEGRADPALTRALRDPQPVRRAAAALTLGRLGNAEQRQAVRLLLVDVDAQVRLSAAQGLTLGKDKNGLPVLVALLADGPFELAKKAEDMLSELVDAPVSTVELAADARVRQQVHKAWSAWLKTREKQIDLNRLAVDSQLVRLQRAKKVTTECVAAFLKLDIKGFKKTLRFPFFMQGMGNQVTNPAQIDQLFQMLGNAQELKDQLKRMSFKITATSKVDEYLEAAPTQEKTFLSKFRRAELVIVYLQISMGGREQPGEGAVFVRLTGGSAGVVGIGNGQRKAKP